MICPLGMLLVKILLKLTLPFQQGYHKPIQAGTWKESLPQDTLVPSVGQSYRVHKPIANRKCLFIKLCGGENTS